MSNSKNNDSHYGTLGRWTLLAMGVGLTIGAGLFSLVGQAAGLTGHSVWLAFGLAVVLGFFYNAPIILASGAVVMDGGPYALISTILGKKYAGMYMASFFLYLPTMAIYAISFGSYLNSVIPSIPTNIGAIIALTVFYIVNLFGMDTLSKFQNIMTTALIVGISSFIIVGLGRINVDVLFWTTNDNFIAKGNKGLFQATCLLTFATYCQYYLIFFSRHAKRPKKDIPFGILGTTLVIFIIYVGMAVVAVSVVPIEHVQNKPLTYVAKEIFSKPLFAFFMVAGPFMALSTTINSFYASYVEPIYSATIDGWFPKSFASMNRRKTPWKILTICWLISMIPILLNFDMNTIANIYLFTDLVLGIFLVVSMALIPKKYPDAWRRREFGKNIPTWGFYIAIAMAVIAQAIIIYNSISSIELYIVIILILAFIIGFSYAVIKDKDKSINTPKIDLE